MRMPAEAAMHNAVQTNRMNNASRAAAHEGCKTKTAEQRNRYKSTRCFPIMTETCKASLPSHLTPLLQKCLQDSPSMNACNPLNQRLLLWKRIYGYCQCPYQAWCEPGASCCLPSPSVQVPWERPIYDPQPLGTGQQSCMHDHRLSMIMPGS